MLIEINRIANNTSITIQISCLINPLQSSMQYTNGPSNEIKQQEMATTHKINALRGLDTIPILRLKIIFKNIM